MQLIASDEERHQLVEIIAVFLADLEELSIFLLVFLNEDHQFVEHLLLFVHSFLHFIDYQLTFLLFGLCHVFSLLYCDIAIFEQIKY